MEVLEYLLTGLLAGELGLLSLVAIVALVTWVVADAALLGRGAPSRRTSDVDRSLESPAGVSIDKSSMYGGLWGNGCDKDGIPRL